MKKHLLVFLSLLLVFALCACKDDEVPKLHVGLLSSAMDAEDHGSNQAAWEAVSSAENIDSSCCYADPYDKDSYVSAISELYSKGCRMIVASDYKLAEAMNYGQKNYKDCYFICIGFSLSSIKSNTVCVSFAEHEAAFLAGAAAALELNSGDFGGILGMDLPSSQRYISGLKSGINYANRNYGTSVTLKDSNIVYIGSYNDSKLAQDIAQQLYESGVSCIFTDGGTSGKGVFDISKAICLTGKKVWVIGTATDNYFNGLYDNHSKSVTLTSAMYKMDAVIDSLINDYYAGKIDGGRLITFGVKQDGVGIYEDSPNLSNDVIRKCIDIAQKIKDGQIVVHDPSGLMD